MTLTECVIGARVSCNGMEGIITAESIQRNALIGVKFAEESWYIPHFLLTLVAPPKPPKPPKPTYYEGVIPAVSLVTYANGIHWMSYTDKTINASDKVVSWVPIVTDPSRGWPPPKSDESVARERGDNATGASHG